MPKTRKLLKVVWADSSSPVDGGWIDPSTVCHKHEKVFSVGYLIKETKQSLTIAAHLAGLKKPDCISGIMTIPKCCILEQEQLN